MTGTRPFLLALAAALLVAGQAAAFSSFKGRFGGDQPADCPVPTPGGRMIVPHSETIDADPAVPALATRNVCSCPDADYVPRMDAAARLTCIDGALLLEQPAQCSCPRRSARHLLTALKPVLVKRWNRRTVTCPSDTVLTGCSVACNGNEEDVDLSPSGNSCRVDSNTRCTGSKGFLMAAICLQRR